MQAFNNLKIRPKMILCFSLVIVLMVSMAVFAVIELETLELTYDTVINHPLAGQEAILEYQSTFRDLRRIVATMSTYTGANPEKCESLYNDTVATYNSTSQYLDQYDEVVNTHPDYTEADKKTRIAHSAEIREIAKQYFDEFLVPVHEAALANDHDLSISILETSGPIATSIRDKINAIVESTDDVVKAQG